jgi:hypothetical protein
VNQTTAKAAVTQMVNVVFHRLESLAPLEKEPPSRRDPETEPATPGPTTAVATATAPIAASTSSASAPTVDPAASVVDAGASAGASAAGGEVGAGERASNVGATGAAAAAAGSSEPPTPSAPPSAGKYGLCVVCQKEAGHFAKATLQPVCSPGCRDQHLRDMAPELRRQQERVSCT